MHSFSLLSVLSALAVLFCTVLAQQECGAVTTTITEITYVTAKSDAEASSEASVSAITATSINEGSNGVKPPEVGFVCDHGDTNGNHGGCQPHIPTHFSSSTDVVSTSSQGAFSGPTSAVNATITPSAYVQNGQLTSSLTPESSFASSVPKSSVHVTLTLVRATHNSTYSTSTLSSTTQPPPHLLPKTSPLPQLSSSTSETYASPPSIFSTSILTAKSSLPTYPWWGSYSDKVLYSHNIHRINHTVANLSWNQTLANAAYSWAQRCIFAHNTSSIPGGYGQNLAGSAPTASISQHISDYWYNGEAQLYIPYYGQSNPPNLAAGHFTQVVWKGTRSVGCATVDCRGSSLGMWYTVCNYYPPGNYWGEYASNVLRPIGNPYVRGNASDIITQNSW